MLFLSVRIRARTAGGIPASRTAHNRTPGRFLFHRIAHWATVSLAPHYGRDDNVSVTIYS